MQSIGVSRKTYETMGYVSFAVTLLVSMAGYPGLAVASSFLFGLFKPEDKREKKNTYNVYTSTPNTVIDPVPVTFGTDMAPGKLIYKEYANILNINDLFVKYPDSDWKLFRKYVKEERGGEFDGMFNVHFNVNYGSEGRIQRCYFNNRDMWCWLILSDWLEWYGDSAWNLDPGYPGTYMDIYHSIGSDTNPFPITLPDSHYMGYGGPNLRIQGVFSDFTHIRAEPGVREQLHSVYDLTIYMGNMKQLPTMTAEISNSNAIYGRDGFNRGTMYSYISSTGSNEPTYYSFRDAKSEYFYGLYKTTVARSTDTLDTYSVLWYNDVVLKTFGVCDLANPALDKTDKQDWYDYITKGTPDGSGGKLLVRDDKGSRLYFMQTRNWENGWWSSDLNHHHAEYSAQIDLFYVDRDTNEVTSVLYNYEIKYTGFDKYEPNDWRNYTSCPALHFYSMELDDNYVYAFAMLTQSEVILRDTRTITQDSTDYYTVYADFSQYPDGYWVGYYASISVNAGNGYFNIERQIITQTSTYIVVNGEFEKYAEQDMVVSVCKYPRMYSFVVTAAYGSTADTIICDVPEIATDDPWIDADAFNDADIWPPRITSVWLQGYGNGYGYNVESTENTVIHLTSPLSRAPEAGERFLCCVDRQFLNDDIFDPVLSNYHEFLRYLDPIKHSIGTQWRVSYYQGNERKESVRMIFKINKNTGAISVLFARFNKVVYYTAYFIEYTITPGWALPQVTSTNVEMFVYWTFMYTDYCSLWTFRFDFATQTFPDEVNDITGDPGSFHASTNGLHTPGVYYHEVIPAKKWNGSAYVDTWYALVEVYQYAVTYKVSGTVRGGTYFLELPNGRFSSEYKLNFISGYDVGVDIYNNGCRALLYRRGIATGFLYQTTVNGSFGYTAGARKKIGKFGWDESIYFYVNRTDGFVLYSNYEVWKYTPPTPDNPTGEMIMLRKVNPSTGSQANRNDWSEVPWNFSSNRFNNNKYMIFKARDEVCSNICDALPSDIITELLSTTQYDSYFLRSNVQADNAYYPPYQIDTEDLNYIKEVIPAKVYLDREVLDIREHRFMYSRTFVAQEKFYDVLNDVVQTTLGFLVRCGKYLKFKVPRPNETAEFYFGIDSATLVSTPHQDTEGNDWDTLNKIYVDMSSYPDNYWRGDKVYCDEFNDPESAYRIRPPSIWGGNPIDRNLPYAFVLEQTSDYIVIDGHTYEHFVGGYNLDFKKDNIHEGSFTYARKADYERINVVQIEFINRHLKYIFDVAEARDSYAIDILGEPEKIEIYKMHGIKRATQAARVAQQMLDYQRYINWMCGFETDIMGMLLCVGNIVGITHPITNWDAKLFRIVGMEEQLDTSVKFELEEYNPWVYHDYGVVIYQRKTSSGFPQPTPPYNVESFEVKEDPEYGYLYFYFKPPEIDSGYFMGARIYVWVTDHYEYVTLSYPSTTVQLAQDIDTDDTIIYYDADTLYGSFPNSGVIWIGNELIYYNGIDSENDAFLNVIRGYKETIITAHMAEDNIYLFDSSVGNSYEIEDSSWAGTTQTFVAVSTASSGLDAEIDAAPEAEIDILGYGVLPYPVALLHES